MNLADQKIGALVVIRGHDDLERLIDGGIALDIVVSIPLLYSVFDPHSAGHDGALVVELDRASQFTA